MSFYLRVNVYLNGVAGLECSMKFTQPRRVRVPRRRPRVLRQVWVSVWYVSNDTKEGLDKDVTRKERSMYSSMVRTTRSKLVYLFMSLSRVSNSTF